MSETQEDLQALAQRLWREADAGVEDFLDFNLLRVAADAIERLSAERQQLAQVTQERDALKGDAGRCVEALILAWGGVCPLTWAMDPTNPMQMAETIRHRGDELQAAESALTAQREELERRYPREAVRQLMMDAADEWERPRLPGEGIVTMGQVADALLAEYEAERPACTPTKSAP